MQKTEKQDLKLEIIKYPESNNGCCEWNATQEISEVCPLKRYAGSVALIWWNLLEIIKKTDYCNAMQLNAAIMRW